MDVCVGTVLLVLSAIRCSDASLFAPFTWTPVIELAQGKLRGLVDTTYDKYLGIPYAKVSGRFKAPEEPPPWNGTFDAIVDRKCKQLVPRLRLPYGTERNCLILNVYVPRQASSSRRAPVMMFVHGGGFYFGSGSSLIYGPERFMEKGVVLVTINYRLGAFGFLCLGLEGAPGNAGLKDQVAALRWINKNIIAFGGDPKSVTVFGESAGSASVDFLVLSKMAKGLFHRAILESSAAMSPYSFNHDPISKASKVALKLGYKTEDPEVLLAIYRNTSANDILQATHADDILEKYSFRPCAENLSLSEEPVISATPYELLSSGMYNEVPMIIGYNDREARLFVGRGQNSFYKFESMFEALLPDDLPFKSDEDKKALAVDVMKFYFGNKTYSKENIEEIIDFFTDAYFHFSLVKTSELYLQTSSRPVYNYIFTFESSRSLGSALSGLPAVRGATHFDEMFYLFEPSARWAPLVGRDRLMAERMTQMWTDFAKTSNPTPSRSRLLPEPWTASTAAQLRFYDLGDEQRMRGVPNPRRIQFWRDIRDKYGFGS